MVLDEESREWLRCLAGTGRDGRHTAEREEALARLHELLLRAAHAELRRRSRPAGVEGRERDDLAHQAADDALLAITSKLDRFRGDSRFATCAYKFVMFEVSAKLGRHHWRNPRCRPATMRGNASPTGSALSDRQRRVFVAIVVDGIPLDAQRALQDDVRRAAKDPRASGRSRIPGRRITEEDMTGWHALDEFLRTDPRDVGCEQAMDVLDIYVDAVIKDGAGATERRYPGVAAHLRACGPCGEDFAGLLAAVTGATS